MTHGENASALESELELEGREGEGGGGSEVRLQAYRAGAPRTRKRERPCTLKREWPCTLEKESTLLAQKRTLPPKERASCTGRESGQVRLSLLSAYTSILGDI